MSRVIIYNKKTGEVCRNMGPLTSSQALRVLSGSRINMNTKEWWSTEVEDGFKDSHYPKSKMPKSK